MGRIVLVLLLCSGSVAAQTTTIHNYVVGSNTQTAPSVNQVFKTDVNGNKLDSVGQLNSFIQVGTYPNQVFYSYSVGQACGRYFPVPPGITFCGITVYKSKDFNTWYPMGYLFNPVPWQTTLCNVNTLCFGASMLGPRASDGHYIFWLQGSEQAAGQAGWGYAVFDCGTTPGGETEGGHCTRLPDPTGNSLVGAETGMAFMDDDRASGWVIYMTPSALYVTSPLTNNLTDFDNTQRGFIGTSGESFNLFRGPNDGTTGHAVYYAVYGQNNAFGNLGGQWWFSATQNPTTGWRSPYTRFDDNNGCQAQMGAPFRMTLGGGQQVYLLNGAQWQGGIAGQALAPNYFVPLTFDNINNNINTFTCVDTFTLPIAPDTPPAAPVNLDQTSTNGYFYAEGSHTPSYVVDGVHTQMQTFTPSKTPLGGVLVWASQVDPYCDVFEPANGTCLGPDGNLGLAVVTLDGSLNPSGVLASTTIPLAQVSWNSVGVPWTLATPLTVTPGTQYGLVVSCVGTCGNSRPFVMTRDLANPYSNGVARGCTGAACQTGPTYAGTWSTWGSGGTDFKFATYTGAPPPPIMGSVTPPPAVYGGRGRRR